MGMRDRWLTQTWRLLWWARYASPIHIVKFPRAGWVSQRTRRMCEPSSLRGGSSGKAISVAYGGFWLLRYRRPQPTNGTAKSPHRRCHMRAFLCSKEELCWGEFRSELHDFGLVSEGIEGCRRAREIEDCGVWILGGIELFEFRVSVEHRRLGFELVVEC